MGKYDVGTIFKNNEGCEAEIIEIINSNTRKIKFRDGHSAELNVDTSNLKKGTFSNPYYKSVLGIGYNGVGEFKIKHNGNITMEYYLWRGFLVRCYDYKYHKNKPTYKSCTVCEEWHCFQNFAKWVNVTFPYHIKDIKFELDKDLLQLGIENKIYSPQTCVWLPYDVNSFLTNIKSNNKSGEIGVSLSNYNTYVVKCRDFYTKLPIYLGTFKTLDEARLKYDVCRQEQAEKAKQYLRDLNYLPEHIIQLIK